MPKPSRSLKRSHSHPRYDWQAIIEEWSQSGKTPRDFCREKKIAHSGFYTWRKRLLAESIPAASSKPSSRLFVPIKVVPPKKAPLFTPGVILTYPNGCQLQLGEEVDVKLLQLLNQAMGVSSC